MFVWPFHLLYKEKWNQRLLIFVDKSLQFLKKKGQNKLLREKLENTNEKVLMRLAGACLRRPVSIDFVAFLVQKYKENIR